ncbi:MAG TPA: hypothetical protein VMI52_08840 [Acetobacteraceae bacterium]|nr:hypothetical protein [Acetobacteraceae bacterium]
MRTPRVRRNPFLSAWLSGANAWAGAARGIVAGQVRRQQSVMLNEIARQTGRFWTGADLPPPPGKTARKRAKRS